MSSPAFQISNSKIDKQQSCQTDTNCPIKKCPSAVSVVKADHRFSAAPCMLTRQGGPGAFPSTTFVFISVLPRLVTSDFTIV